MNFSYFSNFASPGALCRKVDFVRIVNSPQVAQLIDAYRSGNKEAKKKLPAFNFHAIFPAGTRKSEQAIPSGMYILDLDHLTDEELRMIAKIAIPAEEQREQTNIMLVHITPSGKGLRIVAKATKSGIFATCNSISDYQHTLAQFLKCDHKLDEVTTDLARLSFAPKASDVLYLNDRIFSDQAEVTEFAASVKSQDQHNAPPVSNSMLFKDSDQVDYDGVPLSDIFAEYFNITGGLPQEGARNSRFYTAARDLRYICDFNPKTIALHLPDVGLPASEVFQVCVSACGSVRSAVNPAPQNVMRAIAVARANKEGENEENINISNQELKLEYIPSLARDLMKCCPADFGEAVLLSILPILGTLATHVRARYIDGEVHSPSFFTVVTSEQASGKSFARRLVRLLLSSIAEEDAQQREIEAKFREELRMKKNAKEQPEQPRVKIRIVPASISIAKLLQRLDYAEGDHLFTFAEEMDTLIKSNRSGAWSQKNDMYRNAFDNSVYGQDFMSDASYSANLAVYYNLLVLGTPRQTERFFSDVENGLVSRCCFADLPDQFGAKMPKVNILDANTKLRIEHAVTLLREANGMVDLDFLFPKLEEWLEKQRLIALQNNDRARDIFRRRAAVIGFRAVMVFAPLYHLNVKKNRQNLSKFAVEIAEIILNKQLAFAGQKLNNIINDDVHLPHNGNKSDSIYESLPDSFSSAQVESEMRKRGMVSPVRQLIYSWNRCKLISKLPEKHMYKKNKNLELTSQEEETK